MSSCLEDEQLCGTTVNCTVACSVEGIVRRLWISVACFRSPKHPERHEPYLSFRFGNHGFTRKTNPAGNWLGVPDLELAKAAELEREPIDAEVVQQGVLQSIHDCPHRDLSLLLRLKVQSLLNPCGKLWICF